MDLLRRCACALALFLLTESVALAGTKVYVADYPENRIVVIDSSSDTVADTIQLSSPPVSVAAANDGSFVIAVMPEINKLAKIVLPSKGITLFDIPANAGAVGLHPNGRKAYVSCYDGVNWCVAVLDIVSGTVSKTIPLSVTIDYGSVWINNVNVAPSGQKAYVTWGDSSDVSVIDTVQDVFVKNIYSPPSYNMETAFTPDSTHAVVSSLGLNCNYNGGLSTIDAVKDEYLYSQYLAYGTFGVKTTADRVKSVLGWLMLVQNFACL
jgi:YVTN family beta-propeller protein